MAPIWKELAAELKDTEDLVIAKFNADAETPIGENIKGFPTIKFYGRNSKQGVVYQGAPSLEGFEDWLLEHSKIYRKHLHDKEVAEWDGPDPEYIEWLD